MNEPTERTLSETTPATEPATPSAPTLIVRRAELVIRSMLTQCTTPAEIAQALAAAWLLNLTVRPAHEPVTEVPEPLVVWRADNNGIPLGTYRDREEAQAHCEAFHAAGWTQPVTWYEDEATDGMRLHVIHPDAPEGLASDLAVLPIEVLASFDQAGEW